MKKPKNLKQRNADTIMKPLEGAAKTPFQIVEERGWGVVRDLGGRENMTLDWRVQWGNERARLGQILEIHVGKYKLTVAKEELERYLRHV